MNSNPIDKVSIINIKLLKKLKIKSLRPTQKSSKKDKM